MVSTALRRFALGSIAFAMIVSELGFLAYGAFYGWILTRSLFDQISPVYHSNQTCDLPNLVRLANYTWILTLIVPGIAPAVSSIAIISHTSHESCVRNKQAFVAQVSDIGSDLYSKWQESLSRLNWPSVGWEDTDKFEKWFENRCDLPHTLLWVFLGFFLYAVGAIAVVLIYVWTKPAPAEPKSV
jgi:hypothetical protein